MHEATYLHWVGLSTNPAGDPSQSRNAIEILIRSNDSLLFRWKNTAHQKVSICTVRISLNKSRCSLVHKEIPCCAIITACVTLFVVLASGKTSGKNGQRLMLLY